MGVVELQPVQIELDRAPGVRGQQLGEIVGQLLLGQRVGPLIEALADAPDGARVGVDGLGLQPLEPQVLKVQLVVLVERVCGQGFHLEVTSCVRHQRDGPRLGRRYVGEIDNAALMLVLSPA